MNEWSKERVMVNVFMSSCTGVPVYGSLVPFAVRTKHIHSPRISHFTYRCISHTQHISIPGWEGKDNSLFVVIPAPDSPNWYMGHPTSGKTGCLSRRYSICLTQVHVLFSDCANPRRPTHFVLLGVRLDTTEQGQFSLILRVPVVGSRYCTRVPVYTVF